MASARDIAIDLLPHFEESVLGGHVRTYGYFAGKIGLDPAKKSMVIGPPMHAIGGTCAIAAIPVAPLHFVRRADGAWRGVFEEDASESIHVLPHYNVLYIAAREHKYTEQEFKRLGRGLKEVIPKHWAPHFIWHIAIYRKPKDSTQTYFERALESYSRRRSRKGRAK